MQLRKPLFESAFTGFVLGPIDGTHNFKRGMKEFNTIDRVLLV